MDQKTEDFFKLQEALKGERFYGTITEHWQNGEIVLLEKRQTFKPQDFSQLVIVLEK